MNDSHSGMDRRGFLAAAAGVAAMGVLSGQTAARTVSPRPGGEPGRIRKALKYGMIGEGSAIGEKFAIAREAGFEGVELDSPNDLSTDEVLAARDASGLEIPGVVGSQHWKKPLSHPDPGVRMQGRHALERAILDCKAYGGTTVLLVPAVVHAEVSYNAAWERSLQEIRSVIPMASESGVQIAIENVWNNFLLSPLEASRFRQEILQGVPSRHRMTAGNDGMGRLTVGWYFDVGNIWHYGWPAHWLEVLGGPGVARLDIKGFSRAKADKEGRWAGFGVEIDEGDIPWDTVREWIKEWNWSGWATAEVGGGDLARLKDIAARMDRVLGL